MEYVGHTLTERATTLRGEYYTSPETFALEQEQIFCRRWLCIGRSDSIAEPGDYVLATAGSESLIAVRGRDGLARAFFNVCRHRGTRICEQPAGTCGRHPVPVPRVDLRLDGSSWARPTCRTCRGSTGRTIRSPAALSEWEGFLFLNLAAPRSLARGGAGPLLGRSPPGASRG